MSNIDVNNTTTDSETKVAIEKNNQLDDWVKTWIEQIQAARKVVSKRGWLSFLIGGLGPFVIAGLVSLLVPNQSGGIFCWGGTLGMVVAWPILHNLLATRTKKRFAHQLAMEIRQTCEAEGLSRTETVEALSTQVAPEGMRNTILTTVDSETMAMLGIRQRGLAFFDNKGKAKEDDALKFRAITLDYLSHKLYVEAIAALGVISTIYGEIAPPFDTGVNVDFLIQNTYNPTQRVQLATRKVLSSFDFEADLKAILDTSTKRRDASLLNFFLAAQGQGTEEIAALAEASEALKPFIRDKVFIGACIDYLGDRVTRQIQALQALVLIPDNRIVPYLLKAFDLLPFYPQGIDALSRLGESIHPQLLEALLTGNANRRFNVALALGIMKVETAKPLFTDLLKTATDPVERVGCWYGLVNLGEKKWLDEIMQALDHPDSNVRHAAAIALEHLSEPLPDDVYLRHLTDTHEVVRLRLTRKLGAQGTDRSALIDALIARFEDGQESVRSAAVDAVVKLGVEKVYDRMVSLTQNGRGATRDCTYEVLGQLSDPRAEPLLVEALQKYQPDDTRRAILSALAGLQAVNAAEQIGHYLNNKELSGAAFWALLRIGFKDGEAARKILRQHNDRPQKLFALTILGDEGAKRQFKGMLSSSTDIQTLLQACDHARVLSNPDFETPLRNLLSYSNEQFTPTDKYIPYAAFKALIHTLLAKP
ncbi:MAG: HEAT repeat domain-containing protein [Anaerolineae bacterium]|nr:HEAT repeat domain-containing protein [Anaerolineae bacterium]